MNSIFDINRFKLLLLRQIRFNTQTLLIGFGAVVGFLLVITLIKVMFGSPFVVDNKFFGLVMPFFFAGGYVFTSTIFSELRSSNQGYLFLTLPASTFEKLVVSWLITSLLYVLASIFIMFIMNVILNVFSGHAVPLFNLFQSSMLKSYAVYIVTQPVFLLGAIYFRRVNFLKTMLSLFAIAVIISIYSSVAARIIVIHKFSSFQAFDGDMPDNLRNFFENIFAPTIKIIFWYCLAPFFLVVSYFRLKEREV